MSNLTPELGQPLTAREADVMAEIIAGNSNKEAARNLGISDRTVEHHRYRILAKTGARNAADLTRIELTRRYAAQQGAAE